MSTCAARTASQLALTIDNVHVLAKPDVVQPPSGLGAGVSVRRARVSRPSIGNRSRERTTASATSKPTSLGRSVSSLLQATGICDQRSYFLWD